MMLAKANDVGLRLMMCACGHMRASIASLRSESKQHHFELGEKHHIGIADALFKERRI